ncbi:hypothetical protein DSM106972_047370 [Dulcicalothrix desertica PCC 7102]|uniref:Uncharacterized protein n=1 Tax=Dulcicalothrix desertica PCC 7102 TaxID=232991 RepID=A0A433VCM6_9CYAN|nr:hypothetical protein [Dulcicalothrix desertica]RUT03823.1 hypothetical protein DSM106972_047370 [Dulcicalothrix desertica PCC 7102]TWH43768.1 hypothetical protein CAL7102_07512 [Dulcicalothrix desertica PCC 7102]
MTSSNNQDNNDIYAILTELAQRQLQAQTQLKQTQAEILETNLTVRELTNDVNRFLARGAVLDNVVMELRDAQAVMQINKKVMQRNFEQHQRNEGNALLHY